MDMHDEFLRANANHDFISGQFYLVIISILRAVAANDPSKNLLDAAKQMRFVFDLIDAMEGPLNIHSVFQEAVRTARDAANKNAGHEEEIDALRAAVSYLAELSCLDSAARGRASRRRNNFIQHIRAIR